VPRHVPSPQSRSAIGPTSVAWTRSRRVGQHTAPSGRRAASAVSRSVGHREAERLSRDHTRPGHAEGLVSTVRPRFAVPRGTRRPRGPNDHARRRPTEASGKSLRRSPQVRAPVCAPMCSTWNSRLGPSTRHRRPGPSLSRPGNIAVNRAERQCQVGPHIRCQMGNRRRLLAERVGRTFLDLRPGRPRVRGPAQVMAGRTRVSPPRPDTASTSVRPADGRKAARRTAGVEGSDGPPRRDIPSTSRPADGPEAGRRACPTQWSRGDRRPSPRLGTTSGQPHPHPHHFDRGLFHVEHPPGRPHRPV
jgi:hypothetical protein